MSNIMQFMLADGPIVWSPIFRPIQITLLCLMVVCSIFLVVLILLQPSNSTGVSAISGETETFFGKNKSKTKEGLLKTLTIVAISVLTVLSIVFFLLQIFWS